MTATVESPRGVHTDAGVPKVVGDYLKMWKFTRRLVLRRVDTLIVDEVISIVKTVLTAILRPQCQDRGML